MISRKNIYCSPCDFRPSFLLYLSVQARLIRFKFKQCKEMSVSDEMFNSLNVKINYAAKQVEK